MVSLSMATWLQFAPRIIRVWRKCRVRHPLLTTSVPSGTWFRPLGDLLGARGRHATTLRIRDNFCVRLGCAILATMFSLAGVCGHPQATKSGPRTEQPEYDGHWWVPAGHDQREGFFWGAGDCLGW